MTAPSLVDWLTPAHNLCDFAKYPPSLWKYNFCVTMKSGLLSLQLCIISIPLTCCLDLAKLPPGKFPCAAAGHFQILWEHRRASWLRSWVRASFLNTCSLLARFKSQEAVKRIPFGKFTSPGWCSIQFCRKITIGGLLWKVDVCWNKWNVFTHYFTG